MRKFPSCISLPSTATRESGDHNAAVSASATATERKSTAEAAVEPIEGGLFLTAGYGTRADPLSVIRPKALLPWGEQTVMGNLVSQAAVIPMRRLCANASRCQNLIMDELLRYGSEDSMKEVFFEERPLGATSTVCRLGREGVRGTWIVSNTDMVIDAPLRAMLEYHRSCEAHWTVLVGDIPAGKAYGALPIDDEGAFGTNKGHGRHYLGISILEPEVFRIAVERLESGSMFGSLAPASRKGGLKLRSFEHNDEWLDMGSLESIRTNILGRGCFVHPFASVSSGAILRDGYYIGRNSIVAEGALVMNSVMLESSILARGELVDRVLPWYCRHPEVEGDRAIHQDEQLAEQRTR